MSGKGSNELTDKIIMMIDPKQKEDIIKSAKRYERNISQHIRYVMAEFVREDNKQREA